MMFYQMPKHVTKHVLTKYWMRSFIIPKLILLSMVFGSVANADQFCQTLQSFKTEKSHTVLAPVADGRFASVYFVPAQDAKPTLVLLPGVNRGWAPGDKGMKELVDAGYGIASLNFSVQPVSIAQLPDDARVESSVPDMSIEKLAAEANEVMRQIEECKVATSLMPITLSYSGILSQHLKSDYVIDTSPMITSAAANPQLESYRATLKAGEIFNPFFGPAITRSSLDAAYESYWNPMVDGLIKSLNLRVDRRRNYVNGYVSMSRAIEGASWDSILAPKGERDERHYFIVGSKEALPMVKEQVRVFGERLSHGYNDVMFIVMDAGHMVPEEQPRAYVEAINTIFDKSLRANTRAVVIDPSKLGAERFEQLDESAARARLRIQ